LIIKGFAVDPRSKLTLKLSVHWAATMSPDFQDSDRRQRLYRLAIFAFRMTGEALPGLLNAFGARPHAVLIDRALSSAMRSMITASLGRNGLQFDRSGPPVIGLAGTNVRN